MEQFVKWFKKYLYFVVVKTKEIITYYIYNDKQTNLDHHPLNTISPYPHSSNLRNVPKIIERKRQNVRADHGRVAYRMLYWIPIHIKRRVLTKNNGSMCKSCPPFVAVKKEFNSNMFFGGSFVSHHHHLLLYRGKQSPCSAIARLSYRKKWGKNWIRSQWEWDHSKKRKTKKKLICQKNPYSLKSMWLFSIENILIKLVCFNYSFKFFLLLFL